MTVQTHVSHRIVLPLYYLALKGLIGLVIELIVNKTSVFISIIFVIIFKLFFNRVANYLEYL